MKQIEVQIMSQSYLLSCPDDGESRMMAAVKRVNDVMCKIRDAAKTKARDRIAVLAALNLAFELTDESGNNTSSSTTISADQPDLDHTTSQQLTNLIAKLDTALGDDGRLF